MQNHANKRFNNTYANVMASIAISAMLIFSVAGMKAFADTVEADTVETSTNSATIQPGESVDVKYWIVPNKAGESGDPNADPESGCNANSASPAKVIIDVPSGVVTSKNELTFTGCGEGRSQTVTFTSSQVDDYTIDVSVSDSGTGEYFTAPATITLTVEAAQPPRDEIAPELNLPADITQEATDASGAEITYTATATDAVDGEVEVTCEPASGSIFALGTTTVNCSATDAAGNEATGSFNVIVQDTTPPELTLPSAPPAAEATSPQGAEITYTATATDAVDGEVEVTCEPASGSTFPLGDTTVNCSATDAAGNEATGSFTVKVQDTIKPVIQVTNTISDGQQFYFGDVPSAPTCTATDSGSGVTSAGCTVSGYGTAVNSYTVIFTATDNAGNTATQQITYKVLAWTIKGFYQPVDMDTSSATVTNTVKGGSVVPLKLEIFKGTTELTSTTFNNNPVGAFAPKKVSCTPGSTEDAIETLAIPGSASFRYDSTSGQFINNWQTPKQPNACYDVIFTAQDGSTLTAHFKLK